MLDLVQVVVGVEPSSKDKQELVVEIFDENDERKTRESRPKVPGVPHPFAVTFSYRTYLDAKPSEFDKWQCFGKLRV